MSDKRRLVFSIIQFLNREMSSDEISEDAKESLEVASQCLQTAYSFSSEDVHLEVSKTLEDIFRDATHSEPIRKKAALSEAEKEEAERLKVEGNELMRTEQFEAAIEKYSKAIEIDNSNQVFYCNRAAAFTKLSNHYAAIEDCKRAIDMDPNYGKAYGRMGLAYSSVEKHKEAVDCFKKAIEIEPDNESYKSNLKLAEDRLQSVGSPGQIPAGLPAGGFDLSNLLGNPMLMNMATSMLSDPNMQRMMGQIMSGGASEGGPNSMEGLLEAGQRLAEQMQQSNPDLVEQLRRQMGSGPPPPPGQPDI